jgi:nucleoside 2-deoxyribosyltransferase
MPTIYLAGPINGCTDDEAMAWRLFARQEIGRDWTILDPMDRDYRGRERDNATAIVNGDKADIRASDVVLVNATRATWGTAMEVHYAYTRRKRIVAFGAVNPSPWLTHHSDELHNTLADTLLSLSRPLPPLR